MPRKKLTMKERGFVKSITDVNNKETFGNGTQSALKHYNVKSETVAASIASENLRKPHIIEAVEKRILKKEDLQSIQSNLVEKLNEVVNKDGLTVENVPLINQLGINIERNAKLNGDLQDETRENLYCS